MNGRGLRTIWTSWVCGVLWVAQVLAVGEGSTMTEAPQPTAIQGESPAAVTMSCQGVEFTLLDSLSGKAEGPEEYIPVGETRGQWTQMVSVQVVSLSKEDSAAYMRRLRQQFVAAGARELVELGRARGACVWTLKWPASGERSELYCLLLLLGPEEGEGRVEIVQYLQHEGRMEQSACLMARQAWRRAFLVRAALQGEGDL